MSLTDFMRRHIINKRRQVHIFVYLFGLLPFYLAFNVSDHLFFDYYLFDYGNLHFSNYLVYYVNGNLHNLFHSLDFIIHLRLLFIFRFLLYCYRAE